MNSADSNNIKAELKKYKNYDETSELEDADLIIINTCSVREKPVQKLFSEIGQFNVKKKHGAKIGVCGCTASHLGKDIIKRAPYVDFVLGARNISKISEVVDKKGSVEIDINHDDLIDKEEIINGFTVAFGHLTASGNTAFIEAETKWLREEFNIKLDSMVKEKLSQIIVDVALNDSLVGADIVKIVKICCTFWVLV